MSSNQNVDIYANMFRLTLQRSLAWQNTQFTSHASLQSSSVVMRGLNWVFSITNAYMWSAFRLPHKSYRQTSHQGVLWLCSADSRRPSAPPAREIIKGKIKHFHQEPFRAASLEGCWLSELYPTRTVTAVGWRECWAKRLHTGAISSLPSPLPHLLNSFHLFHFPNCTASLDSSLPKKKLGRQPSNENKALTNLPFLA